MKTTNILKILSSILILSLLGMESIKASATLTALTLESNTTTLNKGTTTQLTLTGTYSDNTIRPITSGITYSATDSGRSTAQKQRTVHVLPASDIVYPTIVLSPETNTSLGNTIPYTAITLELNATAVEKLWAINETLAQEQNRMIRVKGYKSEDYYYLYNIPLLKGENEIRLIARSATGVETSKAVTVTSEANTTVPIGMRASRYSDVGSLETEITVGTTLDAVEYLLDSDGDGDIDEIRQDGNFSEGYYDEGRYKPRVTIRTSDNLLFSSDYYAMSLDVKASADQKDPAGAEPIDVAKAFVEAIINDDRGEVERFFLYSGSRWVRMLYENDVRRASMREKLKHINASDWKQEYQPSGAATVTTTVHDSSTNKDIPIGFELTPASFDGYKRGRFWLVRAFY